MSTITRQPRSPARIGFLHRLAYLTVEQYEAMVESGILTKHDRLVLINGYLVTNVTKNPPHVLATENVRISLDGIISPGGGSGARIRYGYRITTSRSQTSQWPGGLGIAMRNATPDRLISRW